MTSSAVDRVSRFVDELLRGRRPRRFTASPEEAEAMMANASGPIGAVSGSSTHLGCKLQPDEVDQRLSCPCHMTAFSWSGKVLFYRLKKAPPDLPRIDSRVRDGQIELFVV